MKKELVKDWMSRKVMTITPETTLLEAHRQMVENRIRRLPVIKGDRLVGLVTLGDVRGAEPSDATSLNIWEVNYVLAKLTMEKIMTRNPITISPNATISEAAWTMLDHKISGLPVVNERGKLIGIITESDIFRLVVQEWDNLEAAARELEELSGSEQG